MKKKYLQDLKGYIFFTIRMVWLKCKSFFHTKTTILLLRAKGVKMLKSNRFFGLPTVVRVPFSTIAIGHGNTFRSDTSSNLIGVNHKCIISTNHKNAVITIGNKCGFSGVTLGAYERITIGNNVLFGANCVITDFDWHNERYASGSKPVTINDNVWLGLNSIVLKGVEIGENTIIGANSVVVSSIPPNVIAAGNPCKIIKKHTN